MSTKLKRPTVVLVTAAAVMVACFTVAYFYRAESPRTTLDGRAIGSTRTPVVSPSNLTISTYAFGSTRDTDPRSPRLSAAGATQSLRPALKRNGEKDYDMNASSAVLPLQPHDQQDYDPLCTLPRGGYKAWRDGVVTVLKPIISRNCTKLFAGDQEEANRTKEESESWTNSLSDSEFLQKTSNCTWLREELSNNLYNTAQEREFPLAYIFIVNARPQSIFRNIKLLYRPQNTFCINYDTKSSPDFKKTFTNIDRCFENILVSSKQENVIWGAYTIMEAQLNCHYDLLKFRESQPPSRKWKYVINLCGKEMPLMSPHEMVSRLSVLNGSSSIIPKKVTSAHKQDLKRIEKKMSWLDDKPYKTDEDLGPIPFHLPLYKSSSYSILSLKFVRFLITDPFAMEVHNFFKHAQHSEEHFYATLYMMPGAPGSYDERLKDHYVRAAHSTWIYNHDRPCQGVVHNSICIITGGDLPMVMATSEDRTFFHNKYFDDKDHTAMDCLEERIVEKNKLEYKRDCNR